MGRDYHTEKQISDQDFHLAVARWLPGRVREQPCRLGSFGLYVLLRHLARADRLWNHWGQLAGLYWSASQSFLRHEQEVEPNLGEPKLNSQHLR